MSQYVAAVPPGGQVPVEVQGYYERFYEASDYAPGHETYADFYTDDAILVMGSNSVQGRDAIIKLRQGMWEKVAKRSHVPRQIFTFGGSSEYMLHGSVGYELKDGRKTSTEWAARGQLVQVDGKLKMKFYQVFLDPTATSRAT